MPIYYYLFYHIPLGRKIPPPQPPPNVSRGSGERGDSKPFLTQMTSLATINPLEVQPRIPVQKKNLLSFLDPKIPGVSGQQLF